MGWPLGLRVNVAASEFTCNFYLQAIESNGRTFSRADRNPHQFEGCSTGVFECHGQISRRTRQVNSVCVHFARSLIVKSRQRPGSEGGIAVIADHLHLSGGVRPFVAVTFEIKHREDSNFLVVESELHSHDGVRHSGLPEGRYETELFRLSLVRPVVYQFPSGRFLRHDVGSEVPSEYVLWFRVPLHVLGNAADPGKGTLWFPVGSHGAAGSFVGLALPFVAYVLKVRVTVQGRGQTGRTRFRSSLKAVRV